MTKMKKLYREQDDRLIAGVIGGLGRYFTVDATVLRVLSVLLVIFTGIFPGVIAYIIFIFIIPERASGHRQERDDGVGDPPFRPWN